MRGGRGRQELFWVLFFQKWPKSNFCEGTALCFFTILICCLNAHAQHSFQNLFCILCSCPDVMQGSACRQAQLLLKFLGMRQSQAHSLPVYQGENTQIKNDLTCKGILCSKSKHKCLLTETTREKEHELHQGSTHRSIQKETFWIWDQAMVYPIPKWGSHSRERSAKNRATDANTAWRQGEEGTGQATHRTQPPPPAELDSFLSAPSRDTGTGMVVTYLGESKPASCRFGVNPECRANLALKSRAALLSFRHICYFFKPQQVPLLYIGLWASTDLTGWDSAKDSHHIM